MFLDVLETLKCLPPEVINIIHGYLFKCSTDEVERICLEKHRPRGIL